MITFLFRPADQPWTYSLLREIDDFGLKALDLVRPPSRFWVEGDVLPPTVEPHVDVRRTSPVQTPAALLTQLPAGDTWRAMSKRSLARLESWFLVTEDPQRRLHAEQVVTLAHQVSLVDHLLQDPNLSRVLVADEVGLGKTIEAGLFIRELLKQQPGLRVLYLSPARLVSNVRKEFDRLGLAFRTWVAEGADGTLADRHLIASIHRASYPQHLEAFAEGPSWDVVVVDEAHHLSAWEPGAGNPVQKYRLVQRILEKLPAQGRLVLLTGTPHQGHKVRFENLLTLLRSPGEDERAVAGRVIYRIKEDIRDWTGRPLFPGRQVNPPLVIDLGPEHRRWLEHIHAFFEPGRRLEDDEAGRRAAGWRAGQALQWATSSVEAGLGFLVRQGIRAGLDSESSGIRSALETLRPYRNGAPDEPIGELFARMSREVHQQDEDDTVDDIEEGTRTRRWRPDPLVLSRLLDEGVALHKVSPDAKWERLTARILDPAGKEKVVLFAQPIETVTALAGFLRRRTGVRPALIIGNQKESERASEIESFMRPDGPQYLVSSRAGGEGLNLQVARRLVHVDVPWNPMELEQRIGRVHRFLSRRTIIVDTVVVRDSREVDTYEVARRKLEEISRVMVPPDRFDALFSRVMSLVPPDELQDILGERPLGPLTEDERRRLSELVTRGFDLWKSFHDRFTEGRSKLRQLDPGQARWVDLARFVESHLDGQRAGGFTALRFRLREGEIQDESAAADVYDIAGIAYACGDYSGMPVTSDSGLRAEQLGLNSPVLVAKLRELALPDKGAGAAHVRWPEREPLPVEGLSRPFGLLVFVKQSLRPEQGSWREVSSTLHAHIVHAESAERALEGELKGLVVRTLLRSTIRIEPDATAAGIIARLHELESRLTDDLRTPSEQDRETRTAHAVTPLFAAVVS